MLLLDLCKEAGTLWYITIMNVRSLYLEGKVMPTLSGILGLRIRK
jgi:hypothetical protein